MIKKAEETDSDLIVSSRYIKGGKAGSLESPFRKLVSFGTRLLAYIIIDPARKTSDPTSGFFLVKKKIQKNPFLR